jgi:hypothetical protein
VRADPCLLAKRGRETVGDEAPVHARALPELEQERAQLAAIRNLCGELSIVHTAYYGAARK